MSKSDIYWQEKEKRAKKAKAHFEEFEKTYQDETADSLNRTKVYENTPLPTNRRYLLHGLDYHTFIELVDKDSVSAIFECMSDDINRKIALLNFASYKNPGGMFLEGSGAQEEALCHESNLYNILIHLEDKFYIPNRKRLNQALYHSNLLYTPDVTFIRGETHRLCDVITCAAPNRKAAKRYRGIPDVEIRNALIDRIDHVLNSAYNEEVDDLILGAFGCGVFGNKPDEVLIIFLLFLIFKYNDCFSHVIFAVPRNFNSKNYEIMSSVLDYYGVTKGDEQSILESNFVIQNRNLIDKYMELPQ